MLVPRIVLSSQAVSTSQHAWKKQSLVYMPRKTTKETKDDNKTAVKKSTSPARKTGSTTKTAAKTIQKPAHPRARTPRARVEPQPAAAPAEVVGQWYRIDLHMHTPGSHDYEQPETSYLDILRQAERRGLSIIAFTDHNTVNGYRAMQRDIADLELLERLGRIRADEMGKLSEYRRLLKKMLVLPGFEVTATFGFHVVGLFPPSKSIRDMEYILMQLHVPLHVLDLGLTEAGATSDVLTAYRMINEAGGIVMAPHANSSSGVFMRGLNIGGQTRMAYTQDPNLNVIELTDLAKGRRSMAMWFNGSKPEYSRKMHVVQGSDAHRLTGSPTNTHRLGIGERTSEVLLPELTFEALRDLFRTTDFHRVRVSDQPIEVATDALRTAREKGNTTTQCFHDALPRRGDKMVGVLSDIAALANADGGSIYIGCEPGITKPCVGLPDAAAVSAALAEEIQKRIEPRLNVKLELQRSDDVDVMHVDVPRGDNPPYVLDGHHFYVRTETETHMANRSEIVVLLQRLASTQAAPRNAPVAPEHKPAQHQQRQPQQQHQQTVPQRSQQPQREQSPSQQSTRGQNRGQSSSQKPQSQQQPQQSQQQQQQRSQQQPLPPHGRGGTHLPRLQGNVQNMQKQAAPVVEVKPNGASTPEAEKTMANGQSEFQFEGTPRSGVEILSVEVRDGVSYYTVRDVRNKSTVRNVTQKSARDLWLYALVQHANDVYDVNTIPWQGDRAVLSRSVRAGKVRYDLALRDSTGKAHIYYGASDDAIDARWKELIKATMPEDAEVPESAGNVTDADTGDFTSDNAGEIVASVIQS